MNEALELYLDLSRLARRLQAYWPQSADHVRGAMDPLWLALSDAERASLDLERRRDAFLRAGDAMYRG